MLWSQAGEGGLFSVNGGALWRISEFDFSCGGKAPFSDEDWIEILSTGSSRVIFLITTRCCSKGSHFNLMSKSLAETSSSSVSPENICTPLHLNPNPSEKPHSRNSISIFNPVARDKASVTGSRKVFRLTDRTRMISRANRLTAPIANFRKSLDFFCLGGWKFPGGAGCFFPE